MRLPLGGHIDRQHTKTDLIAPPDERSSKYQYLLQWSRWLDLPFALHKAVELNP